MAWCSVMVFGNVSQSACSWLGARAPFESLAGTFVAQDLSYPPSASSAWKLISASAIRWEYFSEVFRCTKYSPTSKSGQLNQGTTSRGARLRKYCSQILGVVKRQRCFPTRQNKVRHTTSLSLTNLSFNFCLQQKENLASVVTCEVVHQIGVLWSLHGQQNPLHSGFPQALLTFSSCNCFCRLAFQQKMKKIEETCCSPCNRCNLDDSTGQPKATSQLADCVRKIGNPGSWASQLIPLNSPILDTRPLF